jgi:hypothetical protein
MDQNVSIVLVDKRPYRVIAQENWGLTDEQMKGKHVHHRIHRSKGGTNDPSNLYVCSPWFHDSIWHESEGGFIGLAAINGSKGGKVGGVIAGNNNKEEKKGICDPLYIKSDRKRKTCRENGLVNGKRNSIEKRGFCSEEYLTSSKCKDDRKKAGYLGGLKTFLDQSGCHSAKSKEKSKKSIIESRSKPVKVVWPDGHEMVYYSANEAARVLGIPQGNISACCRKNHVPKRGAWAGFRFTYV